MVGYEFPWAMTFVGGMTSGGLGFLRSRIWTEYQFKRFNHDDIKF